MELIEMVGLKDEADVPATSLPYGKQRRLEIARALATKPSLLLLDEPAAGMNPQETDDLADFICRIKAAFHLSLHRERRRRFRATRSSSMRTSGQERPTKPGSRCLCEAGRAGICAQLAQPTSVRSGLSRRAGASRESRHSRKGHAAARQPEGACGSETAGTAGRGMR